MAHKVGVWIGIEGGIEWLLDGPLLQYDEVWGENSLNKKSEPALHRIFREGLKWVQDKVLEGVRLIKDGGKWVWE